MSKATQRIPTATWRTLVPVQFRLRALLPKMWRALLEARWTDYDHFRAEIDQALKEHDETRKADPRIEPKDPGWDHQPD